MSPRPFRLLRNFTALSGGEVVAKVAGFVAFAYLARVLGPVAYGSVELASSVLVAAALVVDFGLGPVTARHVTRRRELAATLAAEVPALRLLLAAAAFALLVAVAYVTGLPPETRRLTVLLGLSLFALPWVLNWLFQGLERLGWVGLAQPIRMLVFAVGVLVLVSGPDDILRVGFAEIAAAVLMALYFLGLQGAHGIPIRLSFEPGRMRQLLREALPVGGSQILWALNHYAPMLLIGILVGGEEVGWLGAALRVVVSIATFVWLYFFSLYPVLVRSSQGSLERLRELMGRSVRVTAWLGILAGVAGTLLAEPICRLAYGARFGPAGLVLAILVWLVPVTLLSGHARFALIAYGHPVAELLSAAAGTVATVALSWVLMPRFGAAGAAVAMVAAGLVVWGAAQIALRRRVGAVPWLRPTLLPAAAGGAALAAGWLLGSAGLGARAAAGLGLYLASAALLDRRLVGDLAALARLGAEVRTDGGAGLSDSGPPAGGSAGGP